VRNEGWFDPWMLLNAFRKKLKSMGVEFLEADVTGVDVTDNRVERVKVKMH
jgi:FAD-dependent oxidoreductase domain-containing protein 1